MSTISTHILDTALGQPASGVSVALFHCAEGEAGAQIGQGITDTDGRVKQLSENTSLPAGVYELRFAVGPYFAQRSQSCFYPVVNIRFEIDAGQHYHVPLLLNPFGYTTYRGS